MDGIKVGTSETGESEHQCQEKRGDTRHTCRAHSATSSPRLAGSEQLDITEDTRQLLQKIPRSQRPSVSFDK